MDQQKKLQPRHLVASALGLMSAISLGSSAWASGYALREGAADWLATGFAGDTAKAYDASTAWSNPAGMTLLEQSEIDGSVSYIGPSSTFTGTNTNPAAGGNVSGTTGGNAIAAAASAGAFGVYDLSPNLRLGIGLTSPFGERVSYPGNFVGRYQSLVSSITDIDIGPAIAYKVNDQLSIGGGPNFDYLSARLTQAVNVPFLSAYTGQDPILGVHGNNIGIGYNLGVLYQFNDNIRIGVDYRSRIQHNITGAQSIEIPGIYSLLSPETVAALKAANSNAKTSITLPDSLSIGYYQQITPRWAVMSDVQWTDWSLFNSLSVTATSGSTLTIPEHWHNTMYVGVGTNYLLLDNLLLQSGFGYDESPVNDSNRTTRIPDSDHYILGFGAKYQLVQNVSLQLAYAHIFTPGGTINNSAPSPTGLAGVIAGSYADSDNSVTGGVLIKF